MQAQIPNEKDLEAKRSPKFILDLNDIKQQETARLRAWGISIMQKHEHKLNNKWKHTQIVTSGTINAEDIDVRQIYPHQDLHWLIYKHHTKWVLLLLSKNLVLSRHEFVTI